MKKRFDTWWRIVVALLLILALVPVVLVSGPVMAETTSPTLRSITWVDNDSDGTINVGDDLVFNFSESMLTSTLDTATELNDYLDSTASGTADYGTTPTISWNSAGTVLTVTLGTGEAISGGETVNPEATVTDEAGNADATIAPGPEIPTPPAPVGALKWWHILLIALSGLIVVGGLIVLFVLPRRPPALPEEGYEEEF